MKSQISFIAPGIVLATTALGFATAGHLPPAAAHMTPTTVRISDSASAGLRRRVYCYNGIKGRPDRLYRGWACLPEQPSLTVTN